MQCGFCGHTFKEAEGVQGCKNCPLAQGCRMLKCPKCNYENPAEPVWLKRVKAFFNKN